MDSPKYSKLSREAIVSLTGPKGPDYMLLTHVDDVAGHIQWKDEFPSMQRIFHAGDLGRYNWIGDLTLEDVEVLLPNRDSSSDENKDDGLTMYSLDGQVLSQETANKKMSLFCILRAILPEASRCINDPMDKNNLESSLQETPMPIRLAPIA